VNELPVEVLVSGRLDYAAAYPGDTTFYTRHGDWFAWLGLAVGLGYGSALMLRILRGPTAG